MKIKVDNITGLDVKCFDATHNELFLSFRLFLSPALFALFRVGPACRM